MKQHTVRDKSKEDTGNLNSFSISNIVLHTAARTRLYSCLVDQILPKTTLHPRDVINKVTFIIRGIVLRARRVLAQC